MFCSHTKGRRRFLQRKNSVLRPKCSLGRGGELVKSDMGSAQKDGVLFKKLFPMTNNSEKKIKLDPVGSTVRYEMMKLCTMSV